MGTIVTIQTKGSGMGRIMRVKALLACWLAMPLAAQTQVDLRTQTKNADLQAAPYTKPLKSGASLPATCTQGELFFLTAAPSGGSVFACTATNTWASQGALTVDKNGGAVGTRNRVNFLPGPGISSVITDDGTKINIQQMIDSTVLTKAGHQSGQTLFCVSASGSGATYTCAMSPALGSYLKGMVLNWTPDVDGAGGATTLNIDQLGARAVKLPDGVTDPVAGDLIHGSMYTLWYDGGNFRLLYRASSGSGGGGAGSGVTVGNNGTAVGTRSIVNFLPGLGISNVITDDGTKINIQQTIDSAVILTKAGHQSGQTLFCASASGSGATYTCAMSPTVGSYQKGMVLHWTPDVDGVGGATTLNIDQLGARAVKLPDGVTNPVAGDLIHGNMYTLWYDGGNFRLLVPIPVTGSTGARPACSAATRGRIWSSFGGAGVKDELVVCAKNASDVYGWQVLY